MTDTYNHKQAQEFFSPTLLMTNEFLFSDMTSLSVYITRNVVLFFLIREIDTKLHILRSKTNLKSSNLSWQVKFAALPTDIPGTLLT